MNFSHFAHSTFRSHHQQFSSVQIAMTITKFLVAPKCSFCYLILDFFGLVNWDLSMCSGCSLPFNFKRKRHNCYNCGHVFCHSCSSKKSLKASKAPNPNKPYRVCDNCFNKVWKAIESDGSSQSLESLKQVESRSSKKNKKLEFNSSRVSPVPNAGKFVVDDTKRKNDSLCQEVMNLRAQVHCSPYLSNAHLC